MGMKPEFSRAFLKKIKHLDSPLKERLLNAVEDILSNPQKGTPITYHGQKCQKYRFGDYRIIYQMKIDQNRILFLVFDHRKRIYKR